MPHQHDLAAELQKIYDSEIYDSEINVRISWLWDGGLDVWLGDDLNGYEATESVKSAADIVPWLQDVIAHFYPLPHLQKRSVRTSLAREPTPISPTAGRRASHLPALGSATCRAAGNNGIDLLHLRALRRPANFAARACRPVVASGRHRAAPGEWTLLPAGRQFLKPPVPSSR
jgi:hypothetical protein